MTTKETIMAHIRALNIPHEYHEHAPAYTMEDCLGLPYAEPDVTFCKNLLLCNTPRTAFFLYVTLPDKPFRTGDVSKRLGSSRLSFAPAEDLREMLQLTPGSLSPLGLWFDGEQRIRLAIDKDVQREGRIAFHPCDNTATVLFRQEDFWGQVVPALGHETIYI
ncbi:MAG: prolyl-tRNA synthetase associated domain-containing protein [Clostridia bacterium]|nr:prolyl-tRNA synthetase associated domain-containing protein [Clostridia bacterium]